MDRLIRCDCGFETTADTEEELVAKARAHARAVHGSELPTELVRDEADDKDRDEWRRQEEG